MKAILYSKSSKTQKKNSTVKEELRQEKKKYKKERAAYFDKLKEEKYQKKKGTFTSAQPISQSTPKVSKDAKSSHEVMPLNKFLAHCGICSRRDAVQLITEGKVKVNKTVVTEPGYKVQKADEVTYKPKDYITTTDDPQGRKTVLELVKASGQQRVYPIGRLDRNTSGVLLLTNDGDLTQKLSHPSYEVKKIYEVKLDKPLIKNDFDKILKGIKLSDGPITADSLAYADSKDKSIIGIEIHSGRNRIVRRIFEHLGYDVKGLDRVMYAGLTKKNVERGKWRFLSEKEIRLLKYLNASKKPAVAKK